MCRVCVCLNGQVRSLAGISAPILDVDHILFVMQLDVLHEYFEEVGCAHRRACSNLPVQIESQLLSLLIKRENQLILARVLPVEQTCSG